MARRKRKAPEEHENLERWLVSYADFITLLFAFFVVMYGISQVNEGKYKVLSGSLVSAFHSLGHAPVGGGTLILDTATAEKMRRILQTPQEVQAEQKRGAMREKMRNMAGDIQKVLEPLVKEGMVRISEGAQGISVEINASVLFASGEALLNSNAVTVLKAVAQVLAHTDYQITVEGHTDNTPINTSHFPSNWELSVVRATSVVRLFQDNGVAPWRLTATGYGEQRPLTSNDSPEGRARNRRVTVSIDALVATEVIPVPLQAPSPAVTPAASSPNPAESKTDSKAKP